MAETVFILGAGASQEAGAPLMNDFLETAVDLRYAGLVDKNDFELVMKGRQALLATQASADLGWRNLEDLFAAFEMARLLGTAGSLDGIDVERLPDAMQGLITDTLKGSIRLTVPGWRDNQQPELPLAYSEFATLIKHLSRDSSSGSPAKGPHPVSILTFNYDLCIDYALESWNLPLDYCLNGMSEEAVRLLKLHGSLNWALCTNPSDDVRCGQCAKVTSWSIKQAVRHKWEGVPFRMAHEPPTRVPLGKFWPEKPQYACPRAVAGGPMLIPPTYSKGDRHLQIMNVWKIAAKELNEAKNIVVMGFSLPDTDQFFRHFFALARADAEYLSRFCVFDPDEGVERRFREWLGRDARDVLRHYPLKFGEAVSLLLNAEGGGSCSTLPDWQPIRTRTI